MPIDRRDSRRRLFVLASEQGGHFTAAQARQVGYSYQAQAHHVRSGNWFRVDRGVFRLAEWVTDVHDDLARWTLWAKGHAVVSHGSALAVHQIGEFESAHVHLTVPPDFTRRDDALTLHRAELPSEDVELRTGFRVTTPARSLIDVAAEGPDTDQLARALAEALRRGLATRRALRSRAEIIDPRAALHIERALHEPEAS